MLWEIVVRHGSVSASATVDYDKGSVLALDNRFFGILLDGRGLLRTDAVLVQNATTRAKVAAFAQSQESFFASWADSFIRLTGLGVKTGADGEWSWRHGNLREWSCCCGFSSLRCVVPC